MPRHLMIVPSLACPASCAYCFGPHEAGPSMDRKTIESLVRWQEFLGDEMPLEVTFHGGEPLVPGIEFYRMALPLLRNGLAPRKIGFAVQSNMWLANNELLELFSECGVSIGTSLDGPEYINDAQRGEGYFRRTMAGIARARHYALSVGCICTFTSQSVTQAEEIFDFFTREELNFTIHAALPPLHSPHRNHWPLPAEAHGELLVKLLDKYLANLDKVRISTLDSMCRGISAGHGSICTFGDCLGEYLAVGPQGEIYPCQRFAGMPEFSLGNVRDSPSQKELSSSPVWQMFHQRQEQINQQCGDCAHLKYCRGGCPYNVLAANNGRFGSDLRDPHCSAYSRMFDYTVDKAVAEVFSQENLNEVVHDPNPEFGLLQRGKLLSLMKGSGHPYDTKQRARQILTTVALSAVGSPIEVIPKLQRLGIVSSASRADTSLRFLHERLSGPISGLNNLYLHITFACPLHCTHCYAAEGAARDSVLSVEDIIRSCREAAGSGFRHAVITGGEPLAHPERDKLLKALAAIRKEVKPLLTVLRTSLVLPLDQALLERLAFSTDEVVVSLDGNRETHDARRGKGSYDRTVNNLEALLARDHTSDISLATVLTARLINGDPGDAVRQLAKKLSIKRIRFRPVLPLGRAITEEPGIVPESLLSITDPRDILSRGFSPICSCGLGQNLYIEPDGRAYPCYAWHGEEWSLGNITQNIAGILSSARFQELRQHTVNTNHKCKKCPLRYLCGGACRAWSRQSPHAKDDIDAAPVNCTSMYNRAQALFLAALDQMDSSPESWIQAGLPVPELPA